MCSTSALSRRELKLGFVFFRGEDQVGSEFVAAFGNEIFDQRRAAFGKELLHFVGSDIVFAQFLREFEDSAIVLVGFANVIGVAHFDQLAALVQFAFAEHVRI